MLQVVRRHTRALARAVVTALSLTILTTCMLTLTGSGERALCDEALHNCGSALRAACCIGSDSHDAGLPAVATVEAPAPATLAIIATVAGATTCASPRAAWRPEHRSPGPPGVPTYLFVASFRI